jgi:hypothetical protein
MRLLGAPAIPAPGLHPFLGIGTVGLRRAVSIAPAECGASRALGHDPKRMRVSQKIVLRQSPIALCQTSSHMEAGAALRPVEGRRGQAG